MKCKQIGLNARRNKKSSKINWKNGKHRKQRYVRNLRIGLAEKREQLRVKNINVGETETRVVVTIEKVIKSAMELSKKGAVWLEQRKRKRNLELV